MASRYPSTSATASDMSRLMVRVHLVPSAHSVHAARHVAADALSSWGWLSDGVRNDVLAVIAELTTNAFRHAHTDAWLSVEMFEREIEVAVVDDALGLPHVGQDVQDADSGRGISVVAALSSDWGVETLPRGKRVWARLSLAPEAGPVGHGDAGYGLP